MARVVVNILLVINSVLLLPGAMLPLGRMFGMAFLTEIRIANATTQPIQVTPVGTRDGDGGRGPLPIYAWKYLSPWPSSPAADYPIAAGQTLTLTYDMDDVQPTELVVTLADGSTGEMTIGPPRRPSTPTPPLPNPITFTGPGQLSPVSMPVNQALAVARKDRSMTLITVAIYAPWVTFELLRRQRRRLRRKPPPLPRKLPQ